jgi:imidazolonepropionase-like amidohydrolase
MRNLAGVLAPALLFCAAPARADDLAFNHVTVGDVVEGRLLRDQVVRVAGGRIVEAVPSPGPGIPKSTRVVDATGKFLIPGLWDMHSVWESITEPER